MHIFHGIGRPEKVEKSTKPVRLPCERTKLKRPIGQTQAGEPLWCARMVKTKSRLEVLRGF
ncbi:hypothetical protein AK973_1958 [Pseudomonas brassicacearum]|nr:hypothetical protein AK973_1958 [Pseudomonas brassicacearum]